MQEADDVKPRRSSLTSGLTESTVTLDEALKLLSLPRELGAHPESGQPIVAGLGRFGPYIKHGDDYRSLEADDDLFTVDLAGARAARGAEEQGRRQAAAKRVIRQIEATDGGAPLQVLEGRYGPYVTDGDDERLDSARRRSGDAVARGRARAARGAAQAAPTSGRRRRAAPARTRRRRRAAAHAAIGGPASATRSRAKRKAAAAKPPTASPLGQARELMRVTIVGGGLAGCEAAWQAASRGVPVTLYEMRPVRPTAVHKTDRLAELVCSNSFRGDKLDNAVGLLKEEMRRPRIARDARGGGEPRACRRRAGRRSRALRRDGHRRARRASADHHRARGSRRRFPSSEQQPGHRRDRSADVGRAVGRPRALVGRIICTSTTPSARSSSPRPSIAARCFAHRGGVEA